MENSSNILRKGKIGTAVYSPCEKYRYRLDRPLYPPRPGHRSQKGCVNFLMLNPSTATEDISDPTITRCCMSAFRWGYGHVVITNIFAFRSTDPNALYQESHPVGDDNDYAIDLAADADLVVLAWGCHGNYQKRGAEVLKRLSEKTRLFVLGDLTKCGQPRHPLYLKKSLQPLPYEDAFEAWEQKMAKMAEEELQRKREAQHLA